MIKQSLRSAHSPAHGLLGAFLLITGQVLILARVRPISDFYFPFVWIGLILLLDAAVFSATGSSLFVDRRRHFVAMLPISAAFWWLFELFNQAVHNWTYIGAGPYTGIGFVVFATVDFSTVLLAVWSAAGFFNALLPAPTGLARAPRRLPAWLPFSIFAMGIGCVVLPIVLPRIFFGATWLCMFLLLDPINRRLGRPSVLGAVETREWRVPFCFALGSLMCGFFWEAWNFWSMPKWIYTIPYVNHWHIFEMPLLGWSGYLPFGLELFAMGNFVFPVIGLKALSLLPPIRDAGDHDQVDSVSENLRPVLASRRT